MQLFLVRQLPSNMKRLPLYLIALALAGAEAGIPTRSVPVAVAENLAPRVAATVSGIADGGIYTQLNPVLVEFRGLSPAAKVWAEVYQGSGGGNKRGTVLQEARLLPRPNETGIMSLSGLQRVCDSDGQWTVKVYARSVRSEKCLATVSFRLRRDLRSLDPDALLAGL